MWRSDVLNSFITHLKQNLNFLYKPISSWVANFSLSLISDVMFVERCKMSDHVVRTTGGRRITDPPIARFLFNDTRLAIVWLVIRVLVGWTWVSAAMTKINDPDWMLTGEALRRFWNDAIQIPAGTAKPPITFDWYRDFIQSMLNAGTYVWFAKLITVAELTVGILLILGLFTGIAAFIGG